MAMSVEVLFGSFSEDEVVNLYTSETEDLEFVWQEQLFVTAPTGSQSSTRNKPPFESHHSGQLIEKTPSEGDFLDIPTFPDNKQQGTSHGVLSPNIPPNPPSTPVEDLAGNAREGGRSPVTKWNVNATPFIPSSVSEMSQANNRIDPSRDKQLDYHYVRTKLDGFAHSTETQEQGRFSENNKHSKASFPPTGVSSSLDKIQTVGLSSTGSHTARNTGEMSIQEGPGVCDRTGANVPESLSNEPQNRTSDGLSSEDIPMIQVHSHIASNGRTNSATLHSESPIPKSDQSAVDMSLKSSVGVQSSTVQQSENSSSQRTSTTSQESGSHPSPHIPSHSHTITPPPSHTVTSQPTTEHTSNSKTISCSTPSGSVSPQSVTSTGRSSTTPVPSSSTSATLLSSKPKSWASIVGSSSNPSSPAGQGGLAASSSQSTTQSAGSSNQTSSTASGSGLASSGSATCAASGRNGQPQEQQPAVNPDVTNAILRRLGEKLSEWELSHCPVDIQPRGLINQGNWCYMHAPLQALLCCPGMYHLCKSLDPYPPLTREPSPTPITDTMAQFFHEFGPYPKTAPPTPPVPPTVAKKKRPTHRPELLCGVPFRPVYVYDMLQKIKSNLSYKGRQEDAEEFLGCILDRLHMEMVSAKKALVDGAKEDSPSGEPPSVSEETRAEEGEKDEWEQVGPKNKSTITRQTSFSESPITEIFGGELRSAVHRQGAKESATVEPFFSLQLDIQSDDIWTVKDALEALSVRETVHMSEVEAQRRITLARLPPILILHLKRFIFNLSGGSQKLQKLIQYSTELEISKDLLSPAIKNKLTLPQRSYKLWAVVYHHGKTATGGHYTCDTHHPACGGWVRMDDSLVKLVPEEHVLKPPASLSNKVAYLLFYRRLDTIRT